MLTVNCAYSHCPLQLMFVTSIKNLNKISGKKLENHSKTSFCKLFDFASSDWFCLRRHFCRRKIDKRRCWVILVSWYSSYFHFVLMLLIIRISSITGIMNKIKRRHFLCRKFKMLICPSHLLLITRFFSLTGLKCYKFWGLVIK